MWLEPNLFIINHIRSLCYLLSYWFWGWDWHGDYVRDSVGRKLHTALKNGFRHWEVLRLFRVLTGSFYAKFYDSGDDQVLNMNIQIFWHIILIHKFLILN